MPFPWHQHLDTHQSSQSTNQLKPHRIVSHCLKNLWQLTVSHDFEILWSKWCHTGATALNKVYLPIRRISSTSHLHSKHFKMFWIESHILNIITKVTNHLVGWTSYQVWHCDVFLFNLHTTVGSWVKYLYTVLKQTARQFPQQMCFLKIKLYYHCV